MASDKSKALSSELEQQSAWMRRLSRKLLRGVAGAEDALQEARLAALRRGRNERGWLVRVAENVALRGRAKFVGANLVNGQWGESSTLLEVELTASATQKVEF
jgi:DNA-directed RNA polymerase specialized sigma24 family protein